MVNDHSHSHGQWPFPWMVNVTMTIPISTAATALMEGLQQGRKLCCHLVEGPSLLTGFAYGCPDSLAEPNNWHSSVSVRVDKRWYGNRVHYCTKTSFPNSSARIVYTKETGLVTVMYQDQSTCPRNTVVGLGTKLPVPSCEDKRSRTRQQ